MNELMKIKRERKIEKNIEWKDEKVFDEKESLEE